MTRLLLALLAIVTGTTLITLSLRPRRRYITLSGHREGNLWVRRIEA